MDILFLGGDSRQEYASQHLISKGFNSSAYIDFKIDSKIKKEICKAKIIVLPLPLSLDDIHLNISTNPKSIKIDEILAHINENQLIIAGKLSGKMIEVINQNNLKIIDYYNIEYFQIMNALLSAEGSIYLAKSKFSKSIYNSNIAILGFGRIGKILAYLLHLQGASISIGARKDNDLAWGKICGFKTIPLNNPKEFNNSISNAKYDIIINTIPSKIMNETFCKNINKNALIIDIASPPYGMDESLAHQYNINYHRESGIPGRYAPQSAGEIIAKTIIDNILTKEDLF